MNVSVTMTLFVVRGRKASSETMYLFSLKALPKYDVFSLIIISQLSLFCASLECALEDETYEDGAETQVECNRCVCACGNWVCTAMTCEGPYPLQTITVFASVQKGFLLSVFLRAPAIQISSSPALPHRLFFCITLPCSMLAKLKLVLL